MQYYYRLQQADDGAWVGPYTEGRLCIFDAAWAAHLKGRAVQALAVPRGLSPDQALAMGRGIEAAVACESLVGNINHTMFEPPAEWIMAGDDDGELLYERLPAERPSLRVPVTIRPLNGEAELAAALEIQRRAYSPYLQVFGAHQVLDIHETIEELRNSLRTVSAFVAVEGTAVRGSIRVLVRNGVAIVPSFSVDPDYGRRGIGTALLRVVEDCVRGRAHKLYLETPLLAPQPMRFYTVQGFEPAGILRRHYGNLDWIAWEKFLEAAQR